MDIVSIEPKTAKVITKQDYNPCSVIDNVKLITIKRFTAPDGAFNEIVRLNENGEIIIPSELTGFKVKQLNHGVCVPGTIKAWHLHYNQDEVWFIHPDSKVIVGLLDVRASSKTKLQSMKLCLGDGVAQLLFIPRGVAHGLSNPYTEKVFMTYLISNYFNGEDEFRLPAEYSVKEDFWKLGKG